MPNIMCAVICPLNRDNIERGGRRYLNRFVCMDLVPKNVVLTDDPMRCKMLAAHYLEYARTSYEQRGMIGYAGSYKGCNIAVLSVGYGESAALNYLREAVELGAERVIYTGECVSMTHEHKIRDVILADGGCRELLGCARLASKRYSLPAAVCPVSTNDRFFLGVGKANGIVDFATETVYGYARERGISALSILTVSENVETGERVEEHERQSRFNTAARLCFETLAIDK